MHSEHPQPAPLPTRRSRQQRPTAPIATPSPPTATSHSADPLDVPVVAGCGGAAATRRAVRALAQPERSPHDPFVAAARLFSFNGVAWEDGGITALENLAPICKGHHTVKHHGGWLVSQVAGSGGALEWISPTGRRYRVEPERRTPVFESAQDTGRGLTRDAGPAPTRVFGPTRSDVAPF